MTLVLPEHYDVAGASWAGPRTCLSPDAVAGHELEVVRLGIINVMPRAESYEPYLLRPLARASVIVEPIWLRLESHEYTSSDPRHIRRFYRDFPHVLGTGRLDALLLTGAPVEDLAFEQVHYWTELSRILAFARSRFASTLGLCWGALALAKLAGLEKVSYPRKLFGVFRNRRLTSDHPITGDFDDWFYCANSRHSGVPDAVLERARDERAIELLSHGEETGYSLFGTTDRRFLMHLGHPEYEAERLVHEWRRDSTLGRSDVEPPANFDPENPVNVWRSHCNSLFENWLRFVVEQRQPAPGASLANGSNGRRYALGDLVVDLDAHEARVDGAAVELTPREFGLLSYFCERSGRAFTRQQLLSAVWGFTSNGPRTIDTHVRRLREKLGDHLPIVTVRGVGYKLAQRRASEHEKGAVI